MAGGSREVFKRSGNEPYADITRLGDRVSAVEDRLVAVESKIVTRDKRRRATMVPIITMEEIPGMRVAQLRNSLICGFAPHSQNPFESNGS